MFTAIYSSVHEMIADGDKAAKAGELFHNGGARWIGRKFDGWEDVKTKANGYWPEGLELVQGMLYEIEREGSKLPPPVDQKRRKKWSNDSGDDLDLDRLRSGQEYWQTMSKRPTNAPRRITLVANVSAACNVDHQKILWRGATAIVLADLLEKAGYRVDLWAVDAGRIFLDCKPTISALMLKDSGQVLDIATVVNGLSGWFFRTVFFQTYHQNSRRHKRKLADGYGPARLPEPEEIQELAGTNTEVICIDDVWSLEAALRKVRQVIEKLNAQ